MKRITELSELKEIELGIMKHIHKFCCENNITYVLAYGTLLGAVRHNGFIPWDDDIDIQMVRDNYDKFEKLFPEWGKKYNLVVIGHHTKDNPFPRDMLKICDNRTLLVEKAYKCKCKLGVYVDVWPLDKVPTRLSLCDKLWIHHVEFLRRIALASEISRLSDEYKRLSIMKKLFILCFGHGDANRLIEKKEKLSRKYNDIKEDQFRAYFVTNKAFYKKDDLFDPVLHIFEDTYFYIPKNYNQILKLTYGDYMKLPPQEEQIPHHSQDVFWK